MTGYRSLEWLPEHTLRLLDQRLVPQAVEYIDTQDYRQVAVMIREMVVRGAPAIGAAAAYGLALAAYHSRAAGLESLRAELQQAGQALKDARPTAVNLAWAVDRALARLPGSSSIPALQAAILAEADEICAEDVRTNQAIGRHALAALPDPVTFIHHCNTGALATVDYGTALGIIRAAHEDGRKVFVYVDETRPRLQGARLTSWELTQLGIPHAIIVDGASGFVMKRRQVDACVVGCDRVAANGDTANKIGTYNLALAARAHNVPFYVAAPTSTIDLSIPTGEAIPIEERGTAEIIQLGGQQLAPPEAQAFNPAFDVTGAEYITGIVTEAGIAYPPYTESLPRLVAQARALHAAQRRQG
ncbi:MAG: S-methyl-5-thioribose-1-phosphate isomerase [Chloroflexota bacterium]